MQNAAVGPADFGLPTRGAVVTKAILVAASAEKRFPEMCQLTGSISPVLDTDFPIRFQLNLPTEWNGNAVQFGGSGSNGTVVTGLVNTFHLPADAPTPIMRGYATFGGDSGHARDTPNWGSNKQAFANFAGESVKRTRDAASSYIKQYYSRAPRRTFFVGGSKGGHEGLVAAQRYGADYDGVIAYYPAAASFAMQMSWGRMGFAAQATPSARLSAAQQQLVKSRVLQTCDTLDGAEDRVISDVNTCRSAFKLVSLRCRTGSTADDTCLTDAQIAGLEVAATPLTFDFPLSNGLKSIGPYPVLLGGDFGKLLYGDSTDLWGVLYRFSGDDVARQVSGEPTVTWPAFDYRKYRRQVEALSSVYDASNPNLDAFSRHGGKLLLLQGTTDMLVPEDLTTHYWNQLQQRYGANLRRFARYYVQPGFGHGDGDFMMASDTLTILERWADGVAEPTSLVAIDVNPANGLRQRPVCEYPKWPRYRGVGDLGAAASFDCVATSSEAPRR
jgi:feruloyl esterase